MPTVDALLAEILATPDDPAPRLAHADALEPTDPARARFIRVQCQLAGLPPWHAERAALEREQQELAESHAEAWLAELDTPHVYLTFARGFPERAEGSAGDLLEALPRLVARTPLREIDLAESEEAAEADEPVPDPAAPLLAACPALAGIRCLSVADATPHAEDLRTLLSSPNWRALERLAIGPALCAEESTAQALAAATPPETLRTFYAESHMLGLGGEGLVRLAAAPWLARLESFEFRGQGLDDDALYDSAGATAGWRLRRLDLSSVGYATHEFGADALLSWIEQPWFEGLRSLGLRACSVAAALPRAFARATGLTSAELSRTGLETDQLAFLAAAEVWPRLSELHLSGNPLHDEGAEVLARSGHLPAVLDLSACDIRAEGLAFLADAPAVEVLDLRANPLDADDWADALAADRLPRATALGLDARGFSDTLLADLRARYTHLDAFGAGED